MNSFQRERLACAWFFGSIGLIYGIFTARMPALKAMTQASDGQIGFLLLAFGGAAFLGLLASGFVIDKLGAKLVMSASALLATVGLTVAALAISYWQLLAFALLAGIGNGFCDVAMNAQGVTIERRHGVLCMSSLHACFSLGGVLGSLSGSVFAALSLSPFVNFLAVGCGYLLLLPWAFTNTIAEPAIAKSAGPKSGRIPFFVYFLGLLCLCCYVSEGSVGEWGSVLLHSVKNASQQQAALVFACFSATMVIGRFYGDRLRRRLGDFRIVLCGSLISGCAMAVVLLSPWPLLCLGGYVGMGVGFAPIVPIFYSLAGSVPGLSPGRAISTVSTLAYTGLLFFPPFLGMLGDSLGLNNALWIIVGACLCVTLGSFGLRSRLAAMQV